MWTTVINGTDGDGSCAKAYHRHRAYKVDNELVLFFGFAEGGKLGLEGCDAMSSMVHVFLMSQGELGELETLQEMSDSEGEEEMDVRDGRQRRGGGRGRWRGGFERTRAHGGES